MCGAAALVGACFGYMVLLGFADGLRYAAAAILTFAVSFAFYDIKLLRRPWAMPLIAGLINGCTGFKMCIRDRAGLARRREELAAELEIHKALARRELNRKFRQARAELALSLIHI